MAKLYAGLDVSRETTSICVTDDRGQKVFEGKTTSNPAEIVAVLAPYRTLLEKVGLEAGVLTPWLHKELLRKRLPVVCLDARQTRAALAAQRNKTDRNDAKDIAVLLSRGFRGLSYVKSDEAYRYRFLLTCRRALKHKARDLDFSVRGALHALGARVEKRGGRLAIVQATKRRADPLIKEVALTTLRAREALSAAVDELDQVIKRTTSTDHICRRFMTVPGVGPLTALTFKAGVDDPLRFSSSRVVGAHFGLTPRRWESGKLSFLTGVSKYGDAAVRSALYDAASSLLIRCKSYSRLREWGVRLRAKKGFKVAAVACARKLACVLHRMWLTGKDFEPTHGRT